MTTAVIAAGGDFPLRVAEAAAARGGAFVVCLKGFCDPARYAHLPHMVERPGAAGGIIARLRAEGVRRIAMAGQAKRPSMLGLWPDAWARQALVTLGPALLKGDDAFLRGIVALLEGEGFEVIAPQSLLEDPMARRWWCGRGWCWASRPSRARMPCWPAPPRCAARGRAACW